MIGIGVNIGVCVGVSGGLYNYASAWDELTDGTTTFRREVRDGYLCLDKSLTPTAFAGTEGVDWENVKSILANESYWSTRYPSDLTLTVLSSDSIQLDWINHGDIDPTITGIGIRIFRSDETAPLVFTNIDVMVNEEDTYVDTSCNPETQYWYYLDYEVGDLSSDPTSTETATTDPL